MIFFSPISSRPLCAQCTHIHCPDPDAQETVRLGVLLTLDTIRRFVLDSLTCSSDLCLHSFWLECCRRSVGWVGAGHLRLLLASIARVDCNMLTTISTRI